jgi:hypothetical protein
MHWCPEQRLDRATVSPKFWIAIPGFDFWGWGLSEMGDSQGMVPAERIELSA